MAAMKKHAFVKKEMENIKRLIKSGDLSNKILTDYNLYLLYNGQKGLKMQRYQNVATDSKVSTLTVMNAVKSMEKNI